MEGGVEGSRGEEEQGDAGQMGVKTEAGGRAEASTAHCAAERQAGGGRVEAWATAGEVSGLVDGRIDEESVEDDWAAD